MSDDFSENIKKQSYWIRILFMVGFMVAIYVTGVILLVLIIAQALFALFTGEDNRNLRRLGASLTQYVQEILNFLTYNSEAKPFPMSPFPQAGDNYSPVSAAKTGNPEAVSEPEASKKPETSKKPAASKKASASRKTTGPGAAAKKKSMAKRSTDRKTSGSG